MYYVASFLFVLFSVSPVMSVYEYLHGVPGIVHDLASVGSDDWFTI